MGKRKKQPEPPELPKKLHYLLEWREFRHMTQEQLAAEVGTARNVISLIENSERGLGDKWAHRLAVPLKIHPGWLYNDPNQMDTSVLEIWGQIPEENKDQALRTLESFKKRRAV